MSQQQKAGVKRWKKHIYYYTKEILPKDFPTKFFILLTIIQNVQILAFCFNRQLKYSGIGIQQAKWAIKIFNPQDFMKQTDLLDTVLIPFFFLFSLTQFLLLAISFRKYKKCYNEKQQFRSKLVSIIQYILIVYNSVFIIPILVTSLTTIYCTQDSAYKHQNQCYGTQHICLCVLAIMNLIWLLLNGAYYVLFYYTRNPFSECLLAVSNNFFSGAKLLIKIVPVIFLMVDPKLSYKELYIVGIALLFLGHLAIFHIIYPIYRFDSNLDLIIIRIQMYCTLISAGLITQIFFYNLEKPNIFFIFSVISAIPLSILVGQVYKLKKKRLILKFNNLEDKDNLTSIEEYLISTIEYIQSKRKNQQRFSLFSLVRLHQKVCENTDCLCWVYGRKFRNKKQCLMDYDLAYKLLIDLINRVIQEHSKAYDLIILRSYILFYRQGSSVSAAFLISRIIKGKLFFTQQSQILSFLYSFQNSNYEESSMNKYHRFSNKMLDLQKKVDNLTTSFIEYLQQLIDQESSIYKLWHIVDKMMIAQCQAEQLIQQLRTIFPLNIAVLKINYLIYKHIIKNKEKYHKIQLQLQQKKEYMKETMKIQQTSNISFNQNSQLVMLIVHLDTQGQGIILNSSSNILKLLGYTNTQLNNANLNTILPKIYHKFHQEVILNYFNKKDSDIKTRQLVIFPLSKTGNIVRSHFTSKVVPCHRHGINVVSFLRKYAQNNQQEHLIIYDKQSGIIDSVSADLKELIMKSKQKQFSQLIQQNQCIYDVIPDWDHQREIKSTKRSQKDNRRALGQYGKFQISLFRSDGPIQNKHIKILELSKKNSKNQSPFFDVKQQNKDILNQFSTLITGILALQNHSKSKQKQLEQQQTNIFDLSAKHLKTLKQIEHKQVAHDLVGKLNAKNKKQDQQKNAILLSSKLLYATAIGILYLFIFSLFTFNLVSQKKQVAKFLADSKLLQQLFQVQFDITRSTYNISSLRQHYIQNGNKILPEKIKLIEQVQSKITYIQQNIFWIHGQLLENSIILDLANSKLEISYLTNIDTNLTQVRSQTFLDATFQLLSYMKKVLVEMSNQNGIVKTDAIFFIDKNAVLTIAKFYKSLTNQITLRIESNNSLMFIIFYIVIGCSIFLLTITLLTIVFFVYTVFKLISDTLQLYTKIECSALCSMAQKVKKIRMNILFHTESQNIIQLLNESQTAEVNKLKIDQIIVNLIQCEQKAMFIETVTFESYPSGKNFYRKSILAFLVIFTAAIGYIIALTFLSSSLSEVKHSMQQISTIRNRINQISYLSQQFAWDPALSQIKHKVLEHLIQTEKDFQQVNKLYSNLSSLLFANFLQLRHSINSNLDLKKKYRTQFTAILAQIFLIIKQLSQIVSGKLKISFSQINGNWQIIANVFYAVFFILLAVYLKFIMIQVFRQVNDKKQKTEYMCKLLCDFFTSTKQNQLKLLTKRFRKDSLKKAKKINKKDINMMINNDEQ